VTLDSMRVALRGILANRLRSALTMLGILIGTAAVILLVAVGTGIANQVQVQIRNLGTNAIYILTERNTGAGNRGTSARRIRLTKAEIIQAGVAAGVDYSLTLSCYEPSSDGAACGRCDACAYMRCCDVSHDLWKEPRQCEDR